MKIRYEKLISEAKVESWKKFCTEAKGITSVSKLKIIKNNASTEIGFLKKQDGDFTKSPEETIKLLMDTHFPENEKPDSMDDISISWTNSCSFHITADDVKRIFNTFKPDKAPGPDGFKPLKIKPLQIYLIKHIQ